VKVGAWASGHGSYPATPDGRRCNDPIATNISPTPGRDVKGATAIVRSATKLDLSDVTAGGMIDISMSPSVLRGEGGVMILRQLVNTYADLGGVGVQFNVADTEVLKDAQQNPERYRNLLVRVWGYNDYFVTMDRARQNHIIARSVQKSM
jgi:formate C-acetyltransferase